MLTSSALTLFIIPSLLARSRFERNENSAIAAS
jgi:hypothetical protein